jgi:hypothetical protein
MRTKKNTFNSSLVLMGRLFRLKQIQFIVLASVLLIAGSCKKSDTTVSSNVVFKATINGANETPPNASAATGTATLTFNKDTKMFTVLVNFSGITATGAHIHKGDVGVAGGVIFTFISPVTSPINYTSVALDATQVADLNANMYYINIHSTAFLGGEIRGQLIKQ